MRNKNHEITRKTLLRMLGRSRLAWMVFLAGMALTAMAWYSVSAWEEGNARQEFNFHAKDTIDAVQQRLEIYGDILYGARGFFAASNEVTRDEWRRYTAATGLDGHHPGVQTFAFIRYVVPREKAHFEKRVRDDVSTNIVGYPKFAIFPPGKRDDYFPIEFIEPENIYLDLLGMDRGAEADTRKTLERARDSGQLAASGLLQSAVEKLGPSRYFLIVLPLYRNGDNPSSVAARRATLFGFVAARIELAELLKSVVSAGEQEKLFFELYDGGSSSEKTLGMTQENLLYAMDDGHALRAPTVTAERFVLQTGIDVAGRNWVFFFGNRPGFSGLGAYLPAVVLLGGVVISALMFALVLMLVTQRQRVMAEVVRHKSLFSQVLDALPVNIFLKDKDFRFVLINEESARTLGISKEAAVGKTNFDVFPHDVAASLREYDEYVFAVEQLVMREERVVRDGQEKFLLAGKKIIRLPDSSTPMLLGFSFDISDRKKAERELEQQQHFVRQVIDNLPSVIFVKDEKGNFLLINQPGAAFWGMTPEQVVGRNQAEILPHGREVDFVSYLDRLVLDERKSFEMEESFPLQNGEVLWLSMSKRPLPQADGKVHLLGIAADITERKRAENMEQQFGRLLQSSLNEIYQFDAGSLLFLQTSEGARVNLGYSADELSRMTPLDIKPLLTTERLERLIAPLRNGEQDALLFETIHLRKDGTTYPVEVRLQYMDANPPVFLAIILDISVRKRVEQALGESEERLRAILDNTTSVVFLKDMAGRYLLVNNEYLKQLNKFSREQIIGKTDYDIFDEELAETLRANDQEVLRAGRPLEFVETVPGESGERTYIAVKFVLRDSAGEPYAVAGISTDITDRLRLEEEAAHARANELSRSLADAVGEGLIGVDLSHRIVFANPKAQKILDIPETEMQGRKLDEVVLALTADGNALADGTSPAWEMISTGRTFQTDDWSFRRSDGTRFPVSLVIAPISVTDKISGAVLSFQDITQRKQAEIALKETERRQAALLDNIPELAWLKDSESRYIAMNWPCARAGGVTPEEGIGKTDFDLWPAEIAELYRRDDREVMVSRVHKRVEEPLTSKDGKTIWIETIKSPIIDGRGQVVGTVGTARDISARRASEAALTHHMVELARVNAELDEFTHVASHDLQEPVRKLIAFSDWLRKDLGDGLPPRAEQDLGFIVDAAQRMQRLVGDLLALSRTGKVSMVREKVALDDAVNRALEVLEWKVAENNAIISRVPLPSVWGDLTLLSQLYQNLIGNALKFIAAPRPEISLTVEQLDGEWVFGVRDNGIGMDPKYADQIFQPFKRLHGRGQFDGSGIGLSICRKVVERHHGRIWVESEEGRGAHFKFTLGKMVE